jgi:hypothetical protein
MFVFVVALCGAFAASGAEVYRWVDDQGKVHYGERPPPDVKDASRVKVQPPATGAEGPATAAAGQENVPPAAQVPADDVANEAAALRRQRCESARELLKKYEEARFMLTKDADGQQRRATLEEEAAERLRVRREIDQNCGG